nr:hypothetical protein [Tanacetum cinerariifolium]
MVPAAVLTQSKPISILAVRPICADVPTIMVTRPRHAHSIDTKSKSTFRRHITYGQSPKTSNSPPRVTAVPALVVSAAMGKKGKWIWRTKCPILYHDSRTTERLSLDYGSGASVPAVETTSVSSPSVGSTQTSGRADYVSVRYSWSHSCSPADRTGDGTDASK